MAAAKVTRGVRVNVSRLPRGFRELVSACVSVLPSEVRRFSKPDSLSTLKIFRDPGLSGRYGGFVCQPPAREFPYALARALS